MRRDQNVWRVKLRVGKSLFTGSVNQKKRRCLSRAIFFLFLIFFDWLFDWLFFAVTLLTQMWTQRPSLDIDVPAFPRRFKFPKLPTSVNNWLRVLKERWSLYNKSSCPVLLHNAIIWTTDHLRACEFCITVLLFTRSRECRSRASHPHHR